MNRMRHAAPTTLLFTLAMLCTGLIGCVERTISITSEPTGALVMLNDEEVGRTPLQVPFTWYGTYDVRLERDGYHPKWTTADAKAPWWETPGIDLVAEAIPDAQSRINWHFTLDPLGEFDEDAFVQRARNLNQKANLRGNVDAMPTATPGNAAVPPTTQPATPDDSDSE